MHYGNSFSLALLLATLTCSAAQSGNSAMIEEFANQAITEYKKTRDVSAFSDVMSQLQLAMGDFGADEQSMSAHLQISADILNALYSTADLQFDFRKKPSMNSAVPGGGYRAGTDPQDIKDPVVRAEYEKVLEQNRLYSAMYRQQLSIYETIEQMASILNEALANLSCRDLVDLLLSHGMNREFSVDLLSRLEGDEP